jgi:Holliday junction DNA helicase RuvA
MGCEGVAQDHADNFSKESPHGAAKDFNDRQIDWNAAGKNPPEVLVDCGGVGYEVQVPMSTFYNLPANGAKVALLTHFVVRKTPSCCWLATARERQTFRELIKITGIGPRMALAVLSGMSIDDLADAVSQQQAGRLVKVPGIGKKTAERLLLELKGKIGADTGAQSLFANNNDQNDILQALMALGYSDKEASAALKKLPPM